MVMSTNRDSEIYYNIDDGSMDEEIGNSASHRCSMVKRYNMPTFFTPDKSHQGKMGAYNSSSNSP